jgi:ATP-dependent RNA helicase DeaD
MTNSNNSFNSLINDKKILSAIKDIGIETPTEIQIKTIPLITKGTNIIAQSATGTGKTIAFLSAILSMINKQKKIQFLIIVPTRELANQVFLETKKLIKYKDLSACVIFGGTSIELQAKHLRTADIVIGTPGRLIDQFERKNLNLDSVKYLVLDEADRMCDMGFFKDIIKIIDKTPKSRQTLLYSATINKDVSALEKKYMPSAKKIIIETKVDPNNLLQEYYVVRQNQKFALLLHLLKKANQKSIVFSNTKNFVDLIYDNLKVHKVDCYKLHGGLEQRKRTNTIAKYHAHKDAVLISSDVSARGIHVDDLDCIYNYDIPREEIQYVHRIGRTARAGKKGKAIAIITEKEEEKFKRMCKRLKYIVVKKATPEINLVTMEKIEKPDLFSNNKNRFSNQRSSRRPSNQRSSKRNSEFIKNRKFKNKDNRRRKQVN